jgi:hypothetical protein
VLNLALRDDCQWQRGACFEVLAKANVWTELLKVIFLAGDYFFLPQMAKQNSFLACAIRIPALRALNSHFSAARVAAALL